MLPIGTYNAHGLHRATLPLVTKNLPPLFYSILAVPFQLLYYIISYFISVPIAFIFCITLLGPYYFIELLAVS